jgi:membrane-associated phospholipid phosphatase
MLSTMARLILENRGLPILCTIVVVSAAIAPALAGVSRLYLGRRYPSNFWGGVVIGVVGGWVARRLTGRFVGKEA